MTVLRSREVVSVVKTQHSQMPVKNGVEIEPLTPAKGVEPTNMLSYETTPSSDKLVQISDKIGSVSSKDSGFVANQGLRRSARLSLKSSSYDVVENVSSRRKRKAVSVVSSVKVSRVLDTSNGCEADGLLVSDLGSVVCDREEMHSAKKVKSGSLSSVHTEVLGSESVGGDDVGKRCLKLRSGKKLLKPGVSHVGDDVNMSDCEDTKEGNERESETVLNSVCNEGLTIETNRRSGGTENGSEKKRRRFRREDKKKGVSVDDADHGELGLERKIKSTVGEEMEIVPRSSVSGTGKRGRSRLSVEEKGKGKVVEVDSSPNRGNMVDSFMTAKVGSLLESTVAVTVNPEPMTNERADTSTKRDFKERFKSIARMNASRFAHFSVEEEYEDTPADEAELDLPQEEANDAVEDWPGPFSTALKIIKERAATMHGQPKNSSEKSQPIPLVWVRKENQQRDRFMKVAPSLQDLCMSFLAENVDAIASLESVPDVLRHKLTQLLCDCRKMNNHFFDLLASGSPSEIRVRDCSWLTEEQFTKTFERSDTSKLTVLQLDQCGRCLSDYVFSGTLAYSPNKLSALTNISLKGACRLSDAGLKAIVGSAPALRSINLGCCSLLTSDAITNLSDKLGPVLKELYIDECFDIDAMHILPALLKLEHLEVLSISRFESVVDSFIRQFVAVRGQKMKELVLADCTKLTDKSLKAIAESCPGLLSIDLTNLSKLTDTAIGYLANGCQMIQTMKLRGNAFSDEGVAAYVEACGEHLKELSVNHVDKVGHCTALSIAKRARNLHTLDVSWCRNMTNEALGLIVDSCLSLKVLKVFGCTQITNVFTDGHSNEEVKVIGLNESQILKNIEAPHLLPLRYSSV